MTEPARALTAERQVLGSILHSRNALVEARQTLTGDEFYTAQHATLYAVCCDLHDAGLMPDPQSVVAELGRRGQLGNWNNGVDVVEIWQDCATATNVRYHLTQVLTAARIRAIQQAHTRLGQMLEQWETSGSDPDDLLDVAARASVELSLAADTPIDGPVPDVVGWSEFTTVTNPEARWIVPGLIRRHDTMMVLGASGAGKSMLSRQVAVCLASGIHPFTIKRVKPVRTLLVDLENAPDQTAEESGPLVTAVKRLAGTEEVGDRGWIWTHPEGLDLRKRADAMLLERVIAQTRPDVLCMGSLYNAYRRGRDDWDTAAEDVQSVLKKLRSRYGLGLWLEHHMPRKEGSGYTGTPYGGTMWERWPTHGRLLRRHSDAPTVWLLEATFRGDRGERELPIALTRGGRLPWTSVFDEAELDLIVGASS